MEPMLAPSAGCPSCGARFGEYHGTTCPAVTPREKWDGKSWPPRDMLVRHLTDIVDASPRGEWLTSNQQVREAERIIDKLEQRGWTISRKETA